MSRRLRVLAGPGALGLLALGAAPALAAGPSAPVQLVRASYASPAVIGTVPSGSGSYAVKEGGFSALAAYTDPVTRQVSATDFWTLTDRGANGSGPTKASTGFLVPSFAPELLHIHYTGSTVSVVQRIPFHLPAGQVDPARAVTTPNSVGGNGFDADSTNDVTGLALRTDEEPDYNADGSKQLPADPFGLDSESLAVAPDGSFWIGDEYGPSVLHIAADGTELRRLVPVGYSYADAGASVVPVSKVLPASWNFREVNKGTEGLAISPDGTHVYAGLQGPLALPCSTDAGSTTFEGRQALRIVDIDTAAPDAPTLHHEWLYLTDPHPGSTKYFDSDMTYDAVHARVLVDERDSKGVQKSIYSFDPAGPQTDLATVPAANDTTSTSTTTGSGTTSAAGCFDKAPPATVTPIAKTLVANLVNATTADGTPAPYNIYKIEGITLLPDGTLAAVNDNDFGYTQTGSTFADSTDPTTGPDSELRIYSLSAAPAASLPEAPYALLLPLVGLGILGGLVAVRRARRGSALG